MEGKDWGDLVHKLKCLNYKVQIQGMREIQTAQYTDVYEDLDFVQQCSSLTL